MYTKRRLFIIRVSVNRICAYGYKNTGCCLYLYRFIDVQRWRIICNLNFNKSYKYISYLSKIQIITYYALSRSN